MKTKRFCNRSLEINHWAWNIHWWNIRCLNPIMPTLWSWYVIIMCGLFCCHSTYFPWLELLSPVPIQPNPLMAWLGQLFWVWKISLPKMASLGTIRQPRQKACHACQHSYPDWKYHGKIQGITLSRWTSSHHDISAMYDGKIQEITLAYWKVSCHDTNFVITGGTAGCLDDNLQCHQWWQSWHHNDLVFQHYATQPNISSISELRITIPILWNHGWDVISLSWAFEQRDEIIAKYVLNGKIGILKEISLNMGSCQWKITIHFNSNLVQN